MTPLWWVAAVLAAPAALAEAPSLAAWHGQPATATLDIAPGEGGRDAAYLSPACRGKSADDLFGRGPLCLRREAAPARQWTDSSGLTRAVTGGVNAAKWWTHWGSADVEIGRSTYGLEADETLVVSDSVLQEDGSWRVFAMLRYRRTKP